MQRSNKLNAVLAIFMAAILTAIALIFCGWYFKHKEKQKRAGQNSPARQVTKSVATCGSNSQ
jgi:hypothetical protein